MIKFNEKQLFFNIYLLVSGCEVENNILIWRIYNKEIEFDIV